MALPTHSSFLAINLNFTINSSKYRCVVLIHFGGKTAYYVQIFFFMFIPHWRMRLPRGFVSSDLSKPNNLSSHAGCFSWWGQDSNTSYSVRGDIWNFRWPLGRHNQRVDSVLKYLCLWEALDLATTSDSSFQCMCHNPSMHVSFC